MKLHVFYNGTDSNYDVDFEAKGRFMHGEIVSRFGYYAQQKHNSRVLRLHGVGGSKPDANVVTSIAGTLFGVKMREDVQHICNFVMEARAKLMLENKQQRQPDLKLEVMLMGWSRGGIGCIYAAHMLSKIWDKMESLAKSAIKLDIKVIAFDPVSGLGTNCRAINLGWTDVSIMAVKAWLGKDLEKSIVDILKEMTNWWELTEHVSEFHGFYAHDERTQGFATTMPAMLGKPANRQFHLYEVPGTHSTLVGNLYPNGGAAPAVDGSKPPVNQPDAVGLYIYRSVVQKVGRLLTGWGITLDDSITTDWLQSLNLTATYKAEQVGLPSVDALQQYKNAAQKTSIFLGVLSSALNHQNVPGLTDGRGVYLGDNAQDRKWPSNVSLTAFMNEQNTKSILDSWYQALVGTETKLEKLKGNVVVHDFHLNGPGWNLLN